MPGTCVIIGGGIGGLTAAIALQQRGWTAHVFEAAPEVYPVGAGIWVPPNAMQVLDRLGVALSVAVAGVPLERVEVWNSEGHRLQSVDLQAARQAYGYSIVSIHRAALHRLLLERLAPGTLYLGAECVGYDRARDGTVVARFADGSAAQGDVLIGADGIHSAVRRQMFLATALRYADQTSYRGVAEMRLPEELRRTCREVWGPGKRFGFSAIAPDRIYWFAPVDALRDERDEPGTEGATLKKLYDTFPDPIPEILARTPEDSILRTDLYDCPAIQSWCEGNVALLGDAAHATTPNLGQGGAQAIEDAWVIADCLANAEPDQGADGIAAALRRYEEIRSPKAARVITASWELGQAAHWKNPVARAVRDFVVQNTPAWITRRQFDSLYRLNF